jgi:serine/threonine protein kinase
VHGGFYKDNVMASQSSYSDPGGSGQGLSSELRPNDLPSKRLLGKGLASIGYETEFNGQTFARKDFIGVPISVFKNEASKLVCLKDHQNVVKTYGLTVNKTSCSLVLEYMDNDFLAVLKKRKRYKGSSASADAGSGSEFGLTQPFELPEALGFMLQIARGMEHVHEQGIVHGDLKTKNILVTNVKDGDKNMLSVKVADFGLVRTKRKSMPFVSRQARKLDMARWKAPEMLEMLLLEDKNETSSESGSDSDLYEECTGSSSVSADVYSFALTCFHILTGDDPYPNLNWKELVAKIVSGELKPNLASTFPPLLRDLLESCWSKVPAERPTFTLIRRKLEHLQILHPLQVVCYT